MEFSQDLLIDRIYLKKRINSWRIITLIFAFISVGLLGLLFNKAGFSQKNSVNIARIHIEGEIIDEEKRKLNIEKIANDPKIKAVILHINSPGGTFVGGEALYNSLNYLSSKKTLLVTMGTLATSVGYMIALPAHHIFSHRGTITGSIGVFIQSPNFVELSKKIGIDFVTIKSGKNKTALSPFETPNEEANHIIEAAIHDSYISFIDFIIEKRKIPKDLLLNLADGRIYTGNQAKELGLIDSIGGEKEAIELLKSQGKIKNDNFKIIDINISNKASSYNKLKLFSEIFNFFSKKSNLTLEGLLSIWQN